MAYCSIPSVLRLYNVDDKMVVNDELERIWNKRRLTEVLPQDLYGGTERLGRDLNLPPPEYRSVA
jgi:hypothetical protein